MHRLHFRFSHSDFPIVLGTGCSTADRERESEWEWVRGSVTERELVNNWLWVFRSRTVGVACHGSKIKYNIRNATRLFPPSFRLFSLWLWFLRFYARISSLTPVSYRYRYILCRLLCVSVCIFDLIIVVNSFSNRINLEATRTKQISWCEKYLLLEQTRVGGEVSRGGGVGCRRHKELK